MRYLKILIVSLISLHSLECFAQQSILSLGLWNISALSGEIKLGGLYGTGDINTYGINNRLTTSNYYGGILVKSSSYIWNPNFLIVDIDGGYYPESRQDLYLVSPNIYNAINTSKLHLGTVFFPKKLITLSTHLDYDNTYDSRENLTDIKTNSKSYGGTFSFRNQFLPLTMAYNQNDWNSREVLTGRNFNYMQKTIDGRMSKSFGRKDKNDLIYTHNDYTRRDYDYAAIRNIADNLELQDGIVFDSAKRSYFNSNLFGTIQRGNDSFRQFRSSQGFLYRLPYNLTFNSSYGYSYIDRSGEYLGQHTVTGQLGHQLFESLHSALQLEYLNAGESSYHEINNKAGIDLNYTKKTFANGLLNIQYNYSRAFESRASTDVLLNIMNEEYTISDRVLLKRPYIIESSIVIKDATGTAIYQNGLDYTLTSIGGFFEVQRIPGGLISDNAKIYVFYSARQPGSYNYDINLNNFSVNYSLFSGFFDAYFRTTRTDFANVHNAENLLLNYVTEDLYGSVIKYRGASLGAEYDNYQSNIVPYTMMRYFLIWQGNINDKVLYSINANWRDYKIPSEPTHRLYGDINGMFSYAFNMKSKLDINIGYQYQQGQQINLDFFTARTKYSTIVRQLIVSVGVDAYKRVYLENQKTDYVGAYIQVVKKFKY